MHAGLLPIESGALRRANVSFGKRSHLADNARTDGIDGLVTVIANRYSIARGLAQRAVDLVFEARPAPTPVPDGRDADLGRRHREHGCAGEERARRRRPAHAGWRERLARTYGAGWREVARLAESEPSLGETVGPTPTLKAELVYALRHEMAQTLADCVFRRMDLGTAGDPGEAALAACIPIVAGELGWNAARITSEVADVHARVAAPWRP